MLAENERATVACFAPRRIGHVNQWCTNIQASERFYNKVCGLKVEFTEPGLVASFLGTGHTPHDLGLIEVTGAHGRLGRDGRMQLPPHTGAPGLNHLAWELENEKALIVGIKRLQAMRVARLLTADHQIAHSVYLDDPDGNKNEFYVDTVKDWRSRFSGEMDLITSFWDPLSAEGFADARYDDAPKLNPPGEGLIDPWRVTHAVLVTTQPEQLEQFYTTIGGLRVSQRLFAAGHQVIYLQASLAAYEHSLILVEGSEARFSHSSFQLKQQSVLEAALRALQEEGATVECEVDLPWKRSFFLRDPDGVGIEFYVRRKHAVTLAGADSTPLEYLV